VNCGFSSAGLFSFSEGEQDSLICVVPTFSVEMLGAEKEAGIMFFGDKQNIRVGAETLLAWLVAGPSAIVSFSLLF
jgi:hypothetical protein